MMLLIVEKTVIFLKPAKTFDTVYHDEIMNTLPNFGVIHTEYRPIWSSLTLFKSYLSGIKQKVKFNGTMGNEIKINCRVSHRSHSI